jgi:hypothetical protein
MYSAESAALTEICTGTKFQHIRQIAVLILGSKNSKLDAFLECQLLLQKPRLQQAESGPPVAQSKPMASHSREKFSSDGIARIGTNN